MATSTVLDVPSTSKNTETNETLALRASTFRRLHPRAYLERFLAERVRPDGREPLTFRDVSLNVGSVTTADGSALVRLGETTVVCGVKAEIAEPELDHPEHGFVVPNLDLPALCSPRFKPGPPGDEAQVLSERLYETLVSSGTVDTKSLCIYPGKAVWVLYVDATCLNYDGNAYDATLIAMIAALRNVRLPKATFDEETNRTICSRDTNTPLELARLLIPASFGIFDSQHILADASSFEEPLLDTTVSIVLGDGAQPVSVSQLGAGFAKEDALARCLDIAKVRYQEIYSQVYEV